MIQETALSFPGVVVVPDFRPLRRSRGPPRARPLPPEPVRLLPDRAAGPPGPPLEPAGRRCDAFGDQSAEEAKENARDRDDDRAERAPAIHARRKGIAAEEPVRPTWRRPRASPPRSRATRRGGTSPRREPGPPRRRPRARAARRSARAESTESRSSRAALIPPPRAGALPSPRPPPSTPRGRAARMPVPPRLPRKPDAGRPLDRLEIAVDLAARRRELEGTHPRKAPHADPAGDRGDDEVEHERREDAEDRAAEELREHRDEERRQKQPREPGEEGRDEEPGEPAPEEARLLGQLLLEDGDARVEELARRGADRPEPLAPPRLERLRRRIRRALPSSRRLDRNRSFRSIARAPASSGATRIPSARRRFADPARDRRRAGRVAVQADRVRAERHPGAVGRDREAVPRDRDRLLGRLAPDRSGAHRRGCAARAFRRDDSGGRRTPPPRRQARLAPGFEEHRAHGADQDQRRVEAPDPLGDRARDVGELVAPVVERAVRLDVREPPPRERTKPSSAATW